MQAQKKRILFIIRGKIGIACFSEIKYQNEKKEYKKNCDHSRCRPHTCPCPNSGPKEVGGGRADGDGPVDILQNHVHANISRIWNSSSRRKQQVC